MDALFSKTIKSGKTTIFVDVKEAKNKNKYITISGTTPPKDGEDKKFTRQSIVVFDNAADQLHSALGEAVKVLQE